MGSNSARSYLFGLEPATDLSGWHTHFPYLENGANKTSLPNSQGYCEGQIKESHV